MKYICLWITAVLLAGGICSEISIFASGLDEKIVSTAMDSYVFKTYLKGDNVQIESKYGAVIISGNVSEEFHKDLAQKTLNNIPGVKSVDNQILVSPTPEMENSDGWIKAKVKITLLVHKNVDGLGTTVDVKDGTVTLRGVARNQAQKELAEEYAKDVKGVNDVINEMTVSEAPVQAVETVAAKIDDISITAQCLIALLSHKTTSALDIVVKTDNGNVSVTGNVKNQEEKDLVTKILSDIKGVDSVDNQMIVEVSKKP